MVTAAMELEEDCFLAGKVMTNLDSVLETTVDFVDKGPYSQMYGLSSSQVWI